MGGLGGERGEWEGGGGGAGWSFFWDIAKMRVNEEYIMENNRKSIFFSCTFSLVNRNYDNCKTTRL